MPTPCTHVSIDRLTELLEYKPLAGTFRWTESGKGRRASLDAGKVDAYGYLRLKIDGHTYAAGRIAHFLMVGEWPEGQIDHRDGDKLNHRWRNLRDVTQTVNMQNHRKPYKNNQSRMMGVYWHKHLLQWYSQIRVDKKLITLGYFRTAEEAHKAYLTAKRKLHAGCTL